MRKIRKLTERNGPQLRRWAGRLTLALTLLLCAYLLPADAHAADSMYLLEVGTGIVKQKTKQEAAAEEKASEDKTDAEKTDAEKIDFFIVTFTTESSGDDTISKFIFPWKDAWTETCDMAQSSEQTAADAELRDAYGYTAEDLKEDKLRKKQLFQTRTVDQYLFTTPEPIEEIKRIQVFAGDKGEWPCQGIRVYSVDELGGLKRCNTGSSDCYIDFEGTLLAEAQNASGQSLSWSNDRLMGNGARNSTITLKTDGFEESVATHRLQDNSKKTLALRFDFADTYGAGLEAMAAMSGTKNTFRTMEPAETMALTLYYNDIHGMRRAACIPGVLNAVDYTAKLLGGGDKPVGSFAQQGESMVVGIFLPDYASLVNQEGVTVTLGAETANEKLHLTPNGGGLCAQRIERSKKDDASFITMAMYDLSKTEVSASVNQSSGAVDYLFRGSQDKPIFYQPVSSIAGNRLAVGDTPVSLAPYEGSKNLTPRDKTERYLFEAVTDDVDGAGTKQDVLIRIRYTDLEGNAKDSGELNMRTLSRDFNGWFHGSEPEDMGYFRGMTPGQTLRFFVPLAKVKSIDDVEVWFDKQKSAEDDWQMKDFAIYTVTDAGKRTIVWQPFSSGGVSGELYYDRSVVAEEIYRYQDVSTLPTLVQKEADEATKVGPGHEKSGGDGGSGGGSGGGGLGGGGVSVTSAKKIDWSQLRYSMSFKEASQELGFGKMRYNYGVTVHVGGDADSTAANGDCGSKNLFYFRLIFKSGTSGFVLANTQLSSDGFVSGADQTFSISTNQDYGDVVSVQIIPEQSSENDDIFDKLMIKSIDVMRMGNTALVPVWTVSTVGWIDIDYRDATQLQSVTGMTGRSTSQLSRTYNVDGTTYQSTFMLAIQTQGYAENNPQLEANISARITYESESSMLKEAQIADVTKNMYQYINRSPLISTSDIGGKTISDPSVMFRPEHTDRFYFSLNDVRSIHSIDLEITAKENTTWYVSNVTLFQINGTGKLIRNSAGEYERVYEKGQEPTTLAYGDSTNVPTYQKYCMAYRDGTNTEVIPLTINFTENRIELSPEAKQWTTVMSREPTSQNDTLNLFLYPQPGTTADMNNPPVATIQYTETEDRPVRVSTDDMNRELYQDSPVFYATELSASRFGVLNNVNIYNGNIIGTVRGILQQVRSGVVINTWNLEGSGSSYPAGIKLNVVGARTLRRQHVQLQLGPDVPKLPLVAPKSDGSSEDVNNIAVALWFRTDDPSGAELRTPYIYLTDKTGDNVGYEQVGPGQIIDLTFDQGSVSEITGISLVASGKVVGSVDAVHILDEEVSYEKKERIAVRGEYGFSDSVTLSNAPRRTEVATSENVKLVSIDFTTMESTPSLNAGTDGPVRMTLGYYDSYGDLIEKRYEDIRPYLTNGETGFHAGSTANVQMLVDDVEDLRWIELEPYSEQTARERTPESGGAARKAIWVLSNVTAKVGESAKPNPRSVNMQIIEGQPLKLSMADILLTTSVSVGKRPETASTETTMAITGETVVQESEQSTVQAAGQATAASGLRSWAQTMIGADNSLLIESGESVRITPFIEGSTEPLKATLEKLDVASGATGKVSLADTRGYTEASIEQKIAEANEKQNTFTQAAAQATTDSGKAAAQRALQAARSDAEMWSKVKPAVGEWLFLNAADKEQFARDEKAKSQVDSTSQSDNNSTGSEVLTIDAGDVIQFTPPRNFTGSSVSYRITVYSTENASARYVLNITVTNEPDPTTKTLEQLNQEMADAQTSQADAQNENNENLLKIINKLTDQVSALQSQVDAQSSAAMLEG